MSKSKDNEKLRHLRTQGIVKKIMTHYRKRNNVIQSRTRLYTRFLKRLSHHVLCV